MYMFFCSLMVQSIISYEILISYWFFGFEIHFTWFDYFHSCLPFVHFSQHFIFILSSSIFLCHFVFDLSSVNCQVLFCNHFKTLQFCLLQRGFKSFALMMINNLFYFIPSVWLWVYYYSFCIFFFVTFLGW